VRQTPFGNESDRVAGGRLRGLRWFFGCHQDFSFAIERSIVAPGEFVSCSFVALIQRQSGAWSSGLCGFSVQQ